MADGARLALQGGARMTPERWQPVMSLFGRAPSHPALPRDACLAEAGKSPSEVTEVRKLIAGDASAGSFLEDAGSTESSAAPLLPPADLVGGQFRIVSLLGRGGMGEVWLAEQNSPCAGASPLS